MSTPGATGMRIPQKPEQGPVGLPRWIFVWSSYWIVDEGKIVEATRGILDSKRAPVDLAIAVRGSQTVTARTASPGR